MSLGLVGALIPVHPGGAPPYRDPCYDQLWATAQELDVPLCLHLATVRAGASGPSNSIASTTALSPAARSVNDYWVRLSLAEIIFGGVFDRFPRLRVGSVEHEIAWIPHWLRNMDFIYERRQFLTGGWRSASGQPPSELFRRNMFATFIEDDLGVELRGHIGIDNILWGNDFPHTESSWPNSRAVVGEMMRGVPASDRKQPAKPPAVRDRIAAYRGRSRKRAGGESQATLQVVQQRTTLPHRQSPKNHTIETQRSYSTHRIPYVGTCQTTIGSSQIPK